MKYSEYGHYSEDKSEYVITERKTPRHWYNYFYNESYNAFASQVGYGEAFCEDRLGTRALLVTDRCVYVTDRKSGTYHTAVGLPMTEKFDFYECRHGLGYTVIVCEKNGIRTEYTVFVPESGNFELWKVKVANLRCEDADLGVIAYTATDTDNTYRPQGYNSESAFADKDGDLIYSTMMTKLGRSDYGVSYPYMAASEPMYAYDTRKTAFIGTYGTKDCPEALTEHGGCTNSDTFVEKICFAIENDCKLSAGETKTFRFQVGFSDSREGIFEAKKALADADALLESVKTLRRTQTDLVSISTPDEKLNCAFNGFYKYSTAMGSRWARVRHNGYRDRVGDSECLSVINPELAFKNFKLALEYQYPTGYCPRTVIDGAIRDNNFSDCAVWITMCAHSIVMETGDLKLLDEEVKFNDGSTASVFEHLRRSIEYLYNFKGDNGLIKIWGGDWNDGMNLAGLQGKGVSVWLSIAWCRSNKLFMELAHLLGRDELLPVHQKMESEMEELIEKYGWDGEYYITAINDWGEKIGSKESTYGKMYLNPQTWAIFSEIGTPERRKKIYEKVDSYLETPLGTLVNKPGYAEPDPKVGFMTFRHVGSLINSSVYLHPMAWKVAVEAILKRPDKLEMTLNKMLPWNHEYAVTYGEPYILFNMYHCPETGYRSGTAGQSWRTGSTAVLTKNIVRYVFGLTPDIEGLKIEPVLPTKWNECSVSKSFRGCRYDISYHKEGDTCTVTEILADGKKWTEKHLPFEKGRRYKIDVFVK